VFTVQQAVIGYWGSPVLYPGDADLAEQGRKTAQEETDTVLEKIGSESRPSSVTVRAATGLPAEALLEAAADADLLVVGSRGAGGFKSLPMGSVSTQVTHHARCPVVVIPDENI
jgi:nucleotide-binding universal stress UspA family protein